MKTPSHFPSPVRIRAIAAAMALSSVCALGQAKDHVLIMAISNYQSSPKLPGTVVDQASAKHIAGLLGFQTTNVTELSDGQLTQVGMRNALTRLEGQISDGDRAFIFYSGHGTSFRNTAGVCEQGVVTQDGEVVSSSEIASLLSRLRERASRVFVMLDSCFSGGVAKAAGGLVSRSGGKRVTAKFVSRAGAADTCMNPTNQIALVVEPPVGRGGLSSKAAYNPEQNLVFLSASRDNEVSLDAGSQGGLATSSVLKCLENGTAKDSDASGSLSFEEIIACAQGEVGKFFPPSGEIIVNDIIYKPHHLTLAGNTGMPVMAAPSQPAPATSAASTTVTPATAANPKATLQDVFRGRDASWDVRLNINPARLRIGKDAFRISVLSQRAGYLYLLYVGSDNKEFSLLYPDSRDKEGSNRLTPNQELLVPGAFHANGPAGTDHFVAYVSPQPRPAILKLFGKEGAAVGTIGTAAALAKSACMVGGSCGKTAVASRNVSRNMADATPEATTTTQTAPEAGSVPTQADSIGYGAAFAEVIEE